MDDVILGRDGPENLRILKKRVENLRILKKRVENWITLLLPSLPGPLWPGVVVLDKGPINGLNRTKPWFLDFTVFCI